ncbi:hypothetical protein NC653_003322 [Populus alba x Populus x berolinensis]|uniref:GTD-binding domain-containing protein n=1 Tax=Populus alba x Populus x berolinensis TaxID=444605 RepID=A0AAD6RS07_9ROSI|nr:hypothetical protein NC653_003322 [Populus alba x Populus x berolinensis]
MIKNALHISNVDGFEHAARATLYLELEKERSVAANAADEAMTVFLRLQEEKASIETEAKMNFKRESWYQLTIIVYMDPKDVMWWQRI